eukprot:CAMPEP_0115374378 /NCGR_PEP_ID=MMETSP0271-20121206/1924_1 /TAXON_ID=71861 /ORGANISM="Scrippsiella trochoidea, Strain CCMP3099" /LENGTH=86 /DNA_ID=CAMNT_0002797425 /DNA_START=308 /DNA_END=568 /DNA_ORIENTATION=-
MLKAFATSATGSADECCIVPVALPAALHGNFMSMRLGCAFTGKFAPMTKLGCAAPWYALVYMTLPDSSWSRRLINEKSTFGSSPAR